WTGRSSRRSRTPATATRRRRSAPPTRGRPFSARRVDRRTAAVVCSAAAADERHALPERDPGALQEAAVADQPADRVEFLAEADRVGHALTARAAVRR